MHFQILPNKAILTRERHDSISKAPGFWKRLKDTEDKQLTTRDEKGRLVYRKQSELMSAHPHVSAFRCLAEDVLIKGT